MKSTMLAICAVALVIAIPTVILQQFEATGRDGYSQHIVVCLLIEFMEENEGRWPENWSSLKPLYERDPNFQSGMFDEFQERIFVDFGADIQRMREESLANDNSAFRVVFAKYTSGFYPFSEPNSAILEYLRKSSASGSKNIATETTTSELEK
jgi:hypothetical protein